MIKGDIDHFGALSFLQGVLTILKDSGHPGLLLVLDEVETLQRMRGDVRDKSLNALRQLMDEVDSGRFLAFIWLSQVLQPSTMALWAYSGCLL